MSGARVTDVNISVHLAEDANIEAVLQHVADREPYVTVRFAQLAIFVRNPDQLTELAHAAELAAADLRRRISRANGATA